MRPMKRKWWRWSGLMADMGDGWYVAPSAAAVKSALFWLMMDWLV